MSLCTQISENFKLVEVSNIQTWSSQNIMFNNGSCILRKKILLTAENTVNSIQQKLNDNDNLSNFAEPDIEPNSQQNLVQKKSSIGKV